MMSGANAGVSKLDVFLAIADLSNKFNVLEANIIAIVDKKELETEKAVHQHVTDTKETVVNSLLSVAVSKVPKDLPSELNIDLHEKQNLSNEPVRLLVLLNRKCISSYIFNPSVGAIGGIEWLFKDSSQCIRLSYANPNKHGSMLPIAGKFWFNGDKSEFFKPFKESISQCSFSPTEYRANCCCHKSFK